MKIRNGFISNSSSSSFVLRGYLLKDLINEEEVLNRLGYKFDEQRKQKAISEDWYEDFIHECFYDYCWDLSKKGIFITNNIQDIPYGYSFMVGDFIMDSESNNHMYTSVIVDNKPSEELLQIKEKLSIEGPVQIVVGERSV